MFRGRYMFLPGTIPPAGRSAVIITSRAGDDAGLALQMGMAMVGPLVEQARDDEPEGDEAGEEGVEEEGEVVVGR